MRGRVIRPTTDNRSTGQRQSTDTQYLGGQGQSADGKMNINIKYNIDFVKFNVTTIILRYLL